MVVVTLDAPRDHCSDYNTNHHSLSTMRRFENGVATSPYL
jgi:hypothetical protein